MGGLELAEELTRPLFLQPQVSEAAAPPLLPQLGGSWGSVTSALNPQAGPLPSVRPARGPCALVQARKAPRAVVSGQQACRPSRCLRETASLRLLPTLPAGVPRRN